MAATPSPSIWRQLGLASYWFAQSYKWFILLVSVLSAQVAQIVPDGEKNAQWGMVFGIGAVWAIVGPSLFGFISDRTVSRFGKRRLFIAIGAGLTVIALAWLSQAKSLGALVVGYLLLQVSDDVGTGPYAAVIPESVDEERRGRASGLMGVMSVGAQVVSAVIALILGDIMLIYIGIALVNILCAVWVLWALRGLPEPPTAAGQAGFFAGWAAPWKSADFRWVWFTRFLNALGFYLVQPYLRNFLEDSVRTFDVFGLIRLEDAGRAAQVVGLTISLTGIFGAIWCTRVADRIGRKRVIYTSGVVMFAVLIPFATAPAFGVILLLAVLFGFGYGAYQGADWALVSDVLPDKTTAGRDMGIWSSSVTCVQVFAGSAGLLIDAGNRARDGLGYSGAIATAAVLFLLSTVLVRQVRGSR